MYKYNGKLVNEELRNIDPYSGNLTEKEKKLILYECKMNHPYFINAIVLRNKEDSLLSRIYNKITLEEWK